jgi:hypothetical protein
MTRPARWSHSWVRTPNQCSPSGSSAPRRWRPQCYPWPPATPSVLLLFIIRLVNKRAVMRRYTNGRVYNAVAWTTVVAVAGLSVLMVLTTILPGLGLHILGL